MLFFILPFSLAFGATLFSTFYFQKKYYSKIENIQVAVFSAKVQKITSVHLFRIYRISVIMSAPIVAALFLIGGFGFDVGIGFLIGMFSVIIILHIFFIFLIKLDTRFIDRSSYGLIQSFNLLFGGGNMLGIFLLSSALFIVLVYYVISNPSSVGLISIALGASFVATVLRGYRILLIGKNKNLSSKKLSSLPNLPEVLSKLHVLGNMVGAADILETIFLLIVTATIMASFIFPGFVGAIALPSLLFISGIISAGLSAKLIHIGATTNTSKNIFFSLSGSLVLSSVVAFPLIVWAMNENVQYSNIALWFSVVLGFFMLFLIFASQHSAYFKKFFFTMHPLVIVLVFTSGIGIAYLLAGSYGFFILVISVLSLGGIFVSLSIMNSSSGNAQIVAESLELPKEHINIMKKLSSISKNLYGIVEAYILLATIFVILGLFVMYQKEAEYAFAYLSFSLSSPYILSGIFIGIFATFVFIKFLERLLKLKPFLKIQKNETREKKINFIQKVLLDSSGISALKKLTPLIVAIYIVPLLFLWVFGVEFFSGFLYGILIASIIIYIILAIYKNKFLFDTKAHSTYGNDIATTPLPFLKAVGIISLLIIIFIL